MDKIIKELTEAIHLATQAITGEDSRLDYQRARTVQVLTSALAEVLHLQDRPKWVAIAEAKQQGFWQRLWKR